MRSCFPTAAVPRAATRACSAALVNGAAVITTRGPQTPPWLRDGETALLVDPEDPRDLAGAIDHLATDERLAARVRAGARELSVRLGGDRRSRGRAGGAVGAIGVTTLRLWL